MISVAFKGDEDDRNGGPSGEPGGEPGRRFRSFSGNPNGPILNAPSVVRWILYFIIGIHFVRQFISLEADAWILLKLAFIPARFAQWSALELDYAATVLSPIGYTFLHSDWLHVIMNSAFFLAFGSVVARRLSEGRFLVFFALSAVLAAAGTYAVDPTSLRPMIGASGAVSGTVGAVAVMAFLKIGGAPPPGPFANPKTARLFVIVWILINVGLSGIFANLFGVAGDIAWEAHLAGFIAGAVLFPLMARGRIGM